MFLSQVFLNTVQEFLPTVKLQTNEELGGVYFKLEKSSSDLI